MKINTVTIFGSLLLAAGCAHQEQQTASRENESMAAYDNVTTDYRAPEYRGLRSLPEKKVAVPSESSQENSTTSIDTAATAASGDSVVVGQVREALKHDETVAPVAQTIDIAADKGTVTLSGNVSSEPQKQAIEHLVKGTSGVVTVNNQLRVSAAPVGSLTDQSSSIYSNATGQASAKDAFVSDSALTPTGGSESKVFPSAQDSTPKAQSAEDLSLKDNTQSADASTNSLSLKPDDKNLSPTSNEPNSPSKVYSPSQTDAAISSSTAPSTTQTLNIQGTTDDDKRLGMQVVQQLRADTALVAVVPGLDINIDNGKATLKGTVKTDGEKSKIESTVKQVSGVTSIENLLQVGASAVPTDSREQK